MPARLRARQPHPGNAIVWLSSPRCGPRLAGLSTRRGAKGPTRSSDGVAHDGDGDAVVHAAPSLCLQLGRSRLSFQ